jgi:integrase
VISENIQTLLFSADLVQTQKDMTTLKLTKRSADALSPAQKPYLARDADLKGFVLRVYPSGIKSWGVVYRPSPGGRGVPEKFVTIGKAGTLTADQARSKAASLLAKVKLGEDPGGDRTELRKMMSVEDFLKDFETDYVNKRVKASTAVSHKIATSKLTDAHGKLKICALEKRHIIALHSKMSEHPYAANRAVAVWAKAFEWGAERGLVPEGFNPAKGIVKYKEEGRERYLTIDELKRLGTVLLQAETVGIPYLVDEESPKAKHAPKYDNRFVRIDPYAIAAIRLLILTGSRLREILNAQWSHLDLDRGILFLPDSKTGRKPIYLSSPALKILSDLPKVEKNDFIIASGAESKPRSDLKRPWNAIRRAAGLDDLRIHDLRHSFASIGAGASLGLPIIGKLLGHSQASTTQRYAHLDADPLKRAADAIGDKISTAMKQD